MTTTNATAHRPTTLRRLVCLAVATAAFSASQLALAAPAAALNPPQSDHAGVVYQIGGTSYGSIGGFWATSFAAWGRNYVQPPIYFFNTGTVGHYDTGGCGSTTSSYRNGVYCRVSQSIFFDYTDMQARIRQFGDYATGGLLAHEFGHHIQNLLGYPSGSHRSEYQADCLAGMYTRYGYATGRLTGSDYWEFHNWLMSTPQSTTHGSPSLRTEWYRYGWTTYSVAECNRAFQ